MKTEPQIKKVANDTPIDTPKKPREPKPRALWYVKTDYLDDAAYRPALLELFKDHLIVNAQCLYHREELEYAVEGPSCPASYGYHDLKKFEIIITLDENGAHTTRLDDLDRAL